MKRQRIIDEAQEQLLDSFKEDTVLNQILKKFASKKKNPLSKSTYPIELKTFAITVHYLSPRAYRFIRKKLNGALPSPSTITKWYQGVDGSPGFSSQGLAALKELASKGVVVISLAKDEVHIRERHCGGRGLVQFGSIGNNVNSTSELANQALFFLAVGINIKFKLLLGN